MLALNLEMAIYDVETRTLAIALPKKVLQT